MVASTRTEIRDDGLVGVLCARAGDRPAPGVLLLGGSEGGLHERDARALAAEGFTVLASHRGRASGSASPAAPGAVRPPCSSGPTTSVSALSPASSAAA